MNVGIIGYGYWGPILVRNFLANPDIGTVTVCDRSEAQLGRVREAYPQLPVTDDAQSLFADPAIEAVVVATPVHGHFSLALEALKAGKHVLVEKPMTSTADEARILIEEATKRGLTLMVDHTFCYTGAVRKIRELVQSPAFGKVDYFDSTRLNLGIFQPDVNVLWDLAVHDLSILQYVIGQTPVSVSATGRKIADQAEHIAFMTVTFPDMVAHINVSWLSPEKFRTMLIGGENQMIVYDDMRPIESKVRLYDKGVTLTPNPNGGRSKVEYRQGEGQPVDVATLEALAVEVAHFVDCVRNKTAPITGGPEGLALVRILEAANRSLAEGGAPIAL